MSETTCWNIEHGDDAAVLQSDCICCLHERIAALEAKEKKGCVHNDLVYLEEVIERRNEKIATLEAERRWIPCSERLPEENVTVIIPIGIACYCDGRWYNQTGFDGGIEIEATHWMPLPSAPLESGE